MSDIDYDRLDRYHFELPRELIAQHPMEHRIDARLLLLNRQSGAIEHLYVRDLPDLLNPGDALVLNNSKVIPARLIGTRTSTGGRWEGLFLRASSEGIWEILSKTRGKLTPGETLSLRDHEGRDCPALAVIAPMEDGHLAVRPIDEAPMVEILERYGRVPLPPYIRDGQMVDSDATTYQTVYAKHPGSVAAPTAGLHFTADLIRHLQKRGVVTAGVTLHVGLGTFRPVSTERLSEHKMHSEWGELTEAAVSKLNQCRQQSGRVIAVGTTSTRVLESAANSAAGESAADGVATAWSGDTNIFIRPPYTFRSIDGLMTNFHLPKSTLLALVAAFAGYDATMRAYQVAIEQRYRFYSYGDCMLIV
ncbi:tRNA preQ1(34) S-adenosylmethionine ribosyltransferase-isomerase QueA [Aureliella helgolandensis]|uniref:S-adenosylmethionine:tRNA ribosyltransferase-isomerase n=1 Tax=Aureliella helgolandensis TaxID=2527968 RepID=A0A518GDL8_9BACT|nr:tRNA preQ1(34) S-adenosylmethionine ribosyltransferase-isomerase QueA [Aureliella helgolandensis]QDV26699.1 S-adenosylmethionine:tRNA ribosyltransferase-isomerase [Aureliella helgolandensis]